jgi:O-antigen/teichoic acid export membrane protein
MKNESGLDRIIRVILAAVIAVLYFTGVLSGTWAIVLGIVGVVLLITGLTGFCALYKLFGISTLKKSE